MAPFARLLTVCKLRWCVFVLATACGCSSTKTSSIRYHMLPNVLYQYMALEEWPQRKVGSIFYRSKMCDIPTSPYRRSIFNIIAGSYQLAILIFNVTGIDPGFVRSTHLCTSDCQHPVTTKLGQCSMLSCYQEWLGSLQGVVAQGQASHGNFWRLL